MKLLSIAMIFLTLTACQNKGGKKGQTSEDSQPHTPKVETGVGAQEECQPSSSMWKEAMTTSKNDEYLAEILMQTDPAKSAALVSNSSEEKKHCYSH